MNMLILGLRDRQRREKLPHSPSAYKHINKIRGRIKYALLLCKNQDEWKVRCSHALNHNVGIEDAQLQEDLTLRVLTTTGTWVVPFQVWVEPDELNLPREILYTVKGKETSDTNTGGRLL